MDRSYTVLVDACVLCSPLKRNIIVSFAEAGLFRLRWSEQILDETQKAIGILLAKHQHENVTDVARNVRGLLVEAFEDATVTGFTSLEKTLGKVPDEGDKHVIAAAIKSRANIIVTENLKDFPRKLLNRYAMSAQSSDVFIANTLEIYPAVSVEALRNMLVRLGRNGNDLESLVSSMIKSRLVQAAKQLKSSAETS